MKIEEMADVFLNSGNFAKHTFLTLGSPSRYAINLKVSWDNFHIEYLDLHLKENLIRQISFLWNNPSQKPASFRVNEAILLLASRTPNRFHFSQSCVNIILVNKGPNVPCTSIFSFWLQCRGGVVSVSEDWLYHPEKSFEIVCCLYAEQTSSRLG